MSPSPAKGGTLRILTSRTEFPSLDPQVTYMGGDIAFLSSTITRSLTGFRVAEGGEGTVVVPDLATDTGRPTSDGKQWAFTLREGVRWETGKPVTCTDIAYGVSRQFNLGLKLGGPTHGVAYLDIPFDADGNSEYRGPSDGTGQELFDKAVSCSPDGRTITFRLNQPVPDFNEVVTYAFSPVPAGEENTGEEYGKRPISSGPYKIAEYRTGEGGQLVLDRNPHWDPDTDPIRMAYPDRWIVEFGVPQVDAVNRVIASVGEDAYAMVDNLTPETARTVFNDPELATRRVDALTTLTSYVAVNTYRIPDQTCRQALAAAVDRAALLQPAGGPYAGELADGVVSPAIGSDYAPTGLWTGLLGQPIPETGNPALAKALLKQGKSCPTTITYDYPDTQDNRKTAAIWTASLARAGITLKPNPIDPRGYYGEVFSPTGGHLILGAWGTEWPSASTVLPSLYVSGWNLSRANNPTFTETVNQATNEMDLATRTTAWHTLSRTAAAQTWTIPLHWHHTQRLTGTHVHTGTPNWGAWNTWGYPTMAALEPGTGTPGNP